MTDAERREAVRQFIRKWSDPKNGNENQHARSYWIEVFKNILGAEDVTNRLDFEKNVIVDGHTRHIDAYISETHVLIEQKSKGIALDKPGLQSGGDKLTPYEQAKRYNDNLAYDEKARWIVTSNFSEIWIYDMNTQAPEPKKLTLTDLQNKYSLLSFLVRKEIKKLTDEEQISKDAGDIVAVLRNALEKQYLNADDLDNQQSLNALCVRLVFCLYAEDADVFGRKNMFSDYLSRFDARDMRRAIIDLFKVLDIKESERDPYLDDELAQFPYVNGGLFSGDHMIIPQFTEEIRDILLEKAAPFDWAEISPTIFGAIFESTLNPETRRAGGMHYTSVENIHKVIDPLFLEELQNEFEEILETKTPKARIQNLNIFQEKLARLKFLDPACGSGNFLTETYLSLRKLENEILKEKEAAKRGSMEGQISFGDLGEGFDNPIKVSIQQFYGLEINDFACTVAKTALWIAESQMMKKTEDVLHVNMDFLPLKSYVNIVEGNALRMDWNDVVPTHELNYIMGNPPFIGARMMQQGGEKKTEVKDVFENAQRYQDLDYVTCWYLLAAKYIQNTNIHCAFVSTNSICQGEQVPILWPILMEDWRVKIDFAYRTFRWDSEAKKKAGVYCIIIGFSLGDHKKEKKLYMDDESNTYKTVNNINAYLLDAPDCIIQNQKHPICAVPMMVAGNMPRDGGNLVIHEEEYNEILSREPDLKRWLFPYIGAEEFLKNKKRWCLWLEEASPTDINNSRILKDKVQAVKDFRMKSSAKTTQGYAKTPALFAQRPGVTTGYIAVPKTTSSERRYIPMGFMPKTVIASDLLFMIPDATIYQFGVLESNVHMAWMRVLCGRLGNGYRYSKEMVYNTFPWPNPTDSQEARIEQTARAILDARSLYSNSSLADLYNPLTMPLELQKAHTANDKAVMAAYGFSTSMSEMDCVAELMKMYQQLIEQ